MICGAGYYRLAVGALTGAAGAIILMVWYKRRESKIPNKWMKIGRVSGLYLYPIKSCKGLEQNEIECTALGSKVGELRDRMFVVVNGQGKFVTGRDYPKMTQIVASANNGILKLSAPNYEQTVEFSFRSIKNQPQQVSIWNAPAEGYDCGDEAARWISNFILSDDHGLRLLYYGNREEAMAINPSLEKAVKFTKADFRKTDAALFSDAAAFHLISEASVAELNTRLQQEKVSPLNFRPNIVVKGDELIPFEEDSWKWLKIGDVVFRMLAPCGRCVFTTVDPVTVTKSNEFEPVKTLRKYRLKRDSEERKIFQSPVMGIYLGARSLGTISVGDEVMIPGK